MVFKCCFCFDLKYGYYTYAILIVGFRLSIMCTAYYFMIFLCSLGKDVCDRSFSLFPGLLGWLFTSVLYCCLVIVGIIKESSVLMYPCIVLLIIELLATSAFTLLLSIFATPYSTIALLVLFCAYCYDLCCLTSLYKKIRKAEITNTGFRFSNEHDL